MNLWDDCIPIKISMRMFTRLRRRNKFEIVSEWSKIGHKRLVWWEKMKEFCNKIKYKSPPMREYSLTCIYDRNNYEFMTSHSPFKTIIQVLH